MRVYYAAVYVIDQRPDHAGAVGLEINALQCCCLGTYLEASAKIVRAVWAVRDVIEKGERTLDAFIKAPDRAHAGHGDRTDFDGIARSGYTVPVLPDCVSAPRTLVSPDIQVPGHYHFKHR